MKKTMLLLAVAGAMIAGMASCKKEETPALPITQTIDVGLRVGESYTFSLPENLRNDPYAITLEAKHASVSELSVDGSGNRVYKYTPEAGYSGSDQVVVSNAPEQKQNCASHQGPPPAGASQGACTGEQEDHYIVTMNFTMKGSEAASK